MSLPGLVSVVHGDRVFRTGIPAAAAIMIGLMVGYGYGVFQFGPSVAFGSSDFRLQPWGAMGGHVDMATTISGYNWFVADSWRWPLLKVVKPNWPDGTNAYLFDMVPLVGLAGRVARTLTGSVPNLMPFWLTGTYALNAAALVALVRGLGQRSIIATILAAGLGAMAPVVHFHFGHLGNSAHWVFVLALALYAANHARPRLNAAAIAGFAALGVIAISTTLYVYVMTAAIGCAAALQAMVDRRASLGRAGLLVLAMLVSGALPLWVFGVLGDPSTRISSTPFGLYSMNLLSPFWPQSSGVFARSGVYLLTRGSIGATRGQYAGYAHLGLGSLTLVSIAVATQWREMPALLRRHWVMLLAMLTLTAWALSNRVYLGSYLLFSYPLPKFLLHTVLDWFRVDGRFFWPVAWMIIGLGVAGNFTALRPRIALTVSVVALALQFADLSLLRGKISAIVAAPPVSAFGTTEQEHALYQEIAKRGRVVVVPTVNCEAGGVDDYNAPEMVAAIEVQLMASRANAAMPGVFLARDVRDCARERSQTLTELAGNGVLIALTQPPGFDRRAEALKERECKPFALGVICMPWAH